MDIRLQPLRELPALEVDEESVDVRGWELRARDGMAGRVEDLLADADRLAVQSLIVERHGELVLVPVADADIDTTARSVTVPYTIDQLEALPRYRRS